ncbi:MAG: hypothetical protein ACREL7_17910 [Longimicrobiales bacterium]
MLTPTARSAWTALLAVGLFASPAVAQDGQAELQGARPNGQQPAAAPVSAAREIRLVFEREVFRYPAQTGRDPFKSLADEERGPLFDELVLRMIIHSPLPNQSVALLADGSRKIYRLRRGDIIGNATVLDITSTKVTFTVDDFGNRRQEVLDIKANQKEGA